MKHFLFSLIVLMFSDGAHADAQRQRASGMASDGLKWQVYFNFPACDHSQEGRRAGAWCEPSDIGKSEKNNGVEAHLKSWISDLNTKSIYISFFSFSNKNIAAALCAETSARPDLKVTIFLDKGEGQVGALANTIDVLDAEMSDPQHRRYIPGYKTGCGDRLKPRETARGSGGFGGAGNFLQHAKIFMALDQKELPESPSGLNAWIKRSQKIRFTSSSANMSSYGTTLHFENWLFFETPADHYIGQQNLCTMMAFRMAEAQGNKQREQFKSAYQDCEAQISSPPSKDIEYYIVPSAANNKGTGPESVLKTIISSAQQFVKMAIHRFTTGSIAYPLMSKSRQGVSVMVIQDDDTLRASVIDGGSAADVGGYDVRILRMNLDAGIDVTFMETNSETTTHMFHNKFIVVDDRVVFQGAGNFTADAINAGGKDGNYEQFYVIQIPQLVKAYSRAWDYLRETSTSKENHPVGGHEFYCTAEFGKLKLLCSDPRAEDSELSIP